MSSAAGLPVRDRPRHLVVILGDQLDPDSASLADFDPAQDTIWMAEVAEESTHVWSGKARIAVFLAAMRHFAVALRERGWPLHYRRLDDPANRQSLHTELIAFLQQHRPQQVVITQPGDWRVLQDLQRAAHAAGVPMQVREDTHFFCSIADFRRHAQGRRSLRLEYFYRELRQRYAILMNGDGPAGGHWNFDAENRESFGREGPGSVPQPSRFEPDAITREVITLVEERFADHPGSLEAFFWPVTREEALVALQQFVSERLALFGRYQDALWPDEPWLYHSHLAAALNLKLLNPREVVAAAENAYRGGSVPLASAEGFIRQILGWREYVRGIYWTRMPAYAEMNALQAQHPLPGFFWTGDTGMACLRDAITQTLKHGYAHHIQRLMVTGLFALLLGVNPREVHAWYLAVYVDAVEWVELPNTLGMSQYADDGLMASKPYAATGKYIQRMGGPCHLCRYDPGKRIGDTACPFTTLYWDFLMRHEDRLAANPRMALQVKNLVRVSDTERAEIRQRARLLQSADGLSQSSSTRTSADRQPGDPR